MGSGFSCLTLRHMMRLRHSLSGIFSFFALLFFFICVGCKHLPNTQEIILDDGGYPDDVNRIMMLHCTTGPTGGGCHNAAGADNSAGLRLDTWDRLFDGTRHGAAVIPYDTANSSLLHYINIDSTLGSIALPTMPLSSAPLSRTDFLTIKAWIARGAPDKAGNIAFSDNPAGRQKIYLTNQASDVLSVIDAGRHVVMRNIPIGMTNAIEAPHCVRVSKDGQYAYVSFLAGDYIQKIDTRMDKVIAQAKISDGNAQWNVLHLSDDGANLITSDLSRGWMRIINTATMQVTQSIGDEQSANSSPFAHPHGIASTPKFDTIYMTGQNGNTVFKFTPDFSFIKLVTVDTVQGNPAPSQYSSGTYDLHEIMLTPDGSKYFVTCEANANPGVRVMDAHTDKLLAVIPMPVNSKPQEIAISRARPYMFVTCMEASSTVPGTTGVVAVINYQTMQLVKIIYGPFWQPHGVTVDDQAGTFYVASTNIGGPFSGHNHTGAARSSGWYNVYDLNTLELISSSNYEVLSQPYSADTRIK